MRKLYKELKAEMVRHGDTQSDIGEYLGLTQPAISSRFKGITPWTIREIEMLCHKYKRPFEELFKKGKEVQ